MYSYVVTLKTSQNESYTNLDTRNPPRTQDETGSNASHTASIINGNWQFLRRPSDLSNDDTWHCAHIRDVADHLIQTVPRGSITPPGFLELLATDFRNSETHLESVYLISFFVGRT